MKELFEGKQGAVAIIINVNRLGPASVEFNYFNPPTGIQCLYIPDLHIKSSKVKFHIRCAEFIKPGFKIFVDPVIAVLEDSPVGMAAVVVGNACRSPTDQR